MSSVGTVGLLSLLQAIAGGSSSVFQYSPFKSDHIFFGLGIVSGVSSLAIVCG